MSQVKQSCTECRRRKIKCNRQLPCDMCTSRGEGDQCEEQVNTRVSGDRSFPRMKDFRLLAARVAELEEHVAHLRRGPESVRLGEDRSFSVRQHDASVGRSDNLDFTYLTPRKRHRSSPSPSPRSPDSPPPERPLSNPYIGVNVPPPDRAYEGGDSTALMLEDFAMGHSINQERAGKQMGPRISNQLYQAVGKAVSILPDSGRSLFLLNFFAGSKHSFGLCVDSLVSKVIHVPSYMDEFHRFAALPKDRMNMEVRPEWLSVHLVVLCLSLHLLGDTERQLLGVRGDQWQAIAQGLYLASREILFASDFLSHHSLEHLQCIILQGGYQCADAHWALIGSAVKIAQNLGLHRLGKEDVGLETSWPKPWQNPLHREIGRRVWWNIVFLDWSHALSHGMTYCVHSRQNFTAFPSNVDDGDVTLEMMPLSKPLSQYTTSSYTIFRLRFLVLYKEHIDHLVDNQTADYAFIMRLDARLVALRDSLPSHFRDDIEAQRLASVLKMPQIISESMSIRMIAANRLLRLHRPYLIGGYTDSRYRQSTDQCVKSARTILALYESMRLSAPTLLSYWLILFYAFAAAVVIFIHLCNGDHTDKEESRLILFRTMDILSAAARNATSILESLLAAWASLTAEGDSHVPSGRPGMGGALDEETLFRRVVRRVLGNTALPEIPVPTLSASQTGITQSNPTTRTTPKSNTTTHNHLGEHETHSLDGMWQGAVHGHATVQRDFDLGVWSDLGIAPNQDSDLFGGPIDGDEQELESFLASITS
ncbi:hypothetical protein IAR55_005994 [Kwoniella newhampshirensis]|uniref:Zn(2)-C6 fungal-type domain-containing protein n=1 Tax=Kwoniella newhampshirensis TaxID=1651941 RepID=A0AAW0YUB0_9TREE